MAETKIVADRLELSGGTFDADNIKLADGAVGTPSLSFTSDTNTGIYRAASANVRISTGGVDRLDIFNGGIGFSPLGVTNVAILSQGLRIDDGTVASPSVFFKNDLDTGIYRSGANALSISAGASRAAFFSDTSVQIGNNGQNQQVIFDNGSTRPVVNNVISLGNGTTRWTEVFATNGTINTSHSSTKENIVDLEELEVPRAVRYTRDGQEHIGYLNDNLPQEARPVGSTIDNYENSVIGILCNAVRTLQDKIKDLEANQ